MLENRILVIVAHPDDETLGCGGTIARWIGQGCDMRIVFLGEGITARYQPDEFDSRYVMKKSDERNDNAYKALKILGVKPDDIYMGQRYCCRFDQVPLIDLGKEIEHHICEFRPTTIFTHSPKDINIDHVLTYKALLAAIRPISIPFLQSVYSIEIPSSSDWNTPDQFAPNVFSDITDYIDQKLEALKAYGDESPQSPHSRAGNKIKSLAAFRGAQAGLEYAEGFSLVRTIF